jgi:hypothetical protein
MFEDELREDDRIEDEQQKWRDNLIEDFARKEAERVRQYLYGRVSKREVRKQVLGPPTIPVMVEDNFR